MAHCLGIHTKANNLGPTEDITFSFLNLMDGGAWYAVVHGVTTSRIGLSDFTFAFHFHALEEEMATHSSILAWKIPWMEEPGRLLSMGSLRVGYN